MNRWATISRPLRGLDSVLCKAGRNRHSWFVREHEGKVGCSYTGVTIICILI